MTSVSLSASQLPGVRASVPDMAATRGAVERLTADAPARATRSDDLAIEARVDGQVNGGTLTSDQATSLKDFFGEGANGAASTGSLMRTASNQLDQFDRVLDKLRVSLSAGSTYGAAGGYGSAGGAAGGGSGLVVDRLA